MIGVHDRPVIGSIVKPALGLRPPEMGDDPEQMLRDHDMVADASGTAAVICINAVGHGGFKFPRKRSRVAPHAH